MAKNKTQASNLSVQDFLMTISPESVRNDCRELCEIMEQVTNEKPRMWGTAMVGFGEYQYRYTSGREGTWFLVGFSPRKKNITLYLMSGFEQFSDSLSQLGKFTTGSSCLYIRSLSDINKDVLTDLLSESILVTKSNHSSDK